MLSRRLIRIKVFKVLFGRIISGDRSLNIAEDELVGSCIKTADLYSFLLSLTPALKKVALNKIDAGLKKFHPKPEESNPNMKFVNNIFINTIENDAAFNKYCERNGLTWGNYQDFVKEMYNNLITRDYYKEYMESDKTGLDEDLKFIIRFYEEEFEDNDVLQDLLEETSTFWMDDLNYVLNIILGTINSIAKNGIVSRPNAFLKKDDEVFAKQLLAKSLVNYDEYAAIVAKYIPNWEIDRLVTTDLVLIVMGITEAVNFESIPIKVTINEYVDISKYYSTSNSKVFVNGLLDKIIQQMIKEGTIKKSGRGLVGGMGETK